MYTQTVYTQMPMNETNQSQLKDVWDFDSKSFRQVDYTFTEMPVFNQRC